jgi:hypothetical protein
MPVALYPYSMDAKVFDPLFTEIPSTSTISHSEILHGSLGVLMAKPSPDTPPGEVVHIRERSLGDVVPDVCSLSSDERIQANE